MPRKNGKSIEYIAKRSNPQSLYHVPRNPYLTLHAQKCMLKNSYHGFQYLYTYGNMIVFMADKRGKDKIKIIEL